MEIQFKITMASAVLWRRAGGPALGCSNCFSHKQRRWPWRTEAEKILSKEMVSSQERQESWRNGRSLRSKEQSLSSLGTAVANRTKSLGHPEGVPRITHIAQVDCMPFPASRGRTPWFLPFQGCTQIEEVSLKGNQGTVSGFERCRETSRADQHTGYL